MMRVWMLGSLALMYAERLFVRQEHAARATNGNKTQHAPLSRVAYYMNMDKDVARNEHTRKLLDDIGFDEIHRFVDLGRGHQFGTRGGTSARRHLGGELGLGHL